MASSRRSPFSRVAASGLPSTPEAERELFHDLLLGRFAVVAWPAGVPRPLASSLNLGAGETVPNLVVVPLGTGGAISLFNNLGRVHLVADVVGWYG